MPCDGPPTARRSVEAGSLRSAAPVAQGIEAAGLDNLVHGHWERGRPLDRTPTMMMMTKTPLIYIAL
eukprot:2736297-Pyramimonas_sp.AAC.1